MIAVCNNYIHASIWETIVTNQLLSACHHSLSGTEEEKHTPAHQYIHSILEILVRELFIVIKLIYHLAKPYNLPRVDLYLQVWEAWGRDNTTNKDNNKDI